MNAWRPICIKLWVLESDTICIMEIMVQSWANSESRDLDATMSTRSHDTRYLSIFTRPFEDIVLEFGSFSWCIVVTLIAADFVWPVIGVINDAIKYPTYHIDDDSGRQRQQRLWFSAPSLREFPSWGVSAVSSFSATQSGSTFLFWLLSVPVTSPFFHRPWRHRLLRPKLPRGI